MAVGMRGEVNLGRAAGGAEAGGLQLGVSCEDAVAPPPRSAGGAVRPREGLLSTCGARSSGCAMEELRAVGKGRASEQLAPSCGNTDHRLVSSGCERQSSYWEMNALRMP